jgi:hypothetical protein
VVFLAGILGLDGSPDFGIGLFDQDVAVVHGSPLKTVVLVLQANKGCPGERLIARWLPGGTLPSGSPRQRCRPCGGRGAYRQSRTS